MTVENPAPTLASIKAVFVDWLRDRTGLDVYEHATPTNVDTTRPWLVVHWIPGGGQEGPAAARSNMWSIVTQITAVAHSTNGRAPIPAAIHDAAQAASDTARGAMCAPTQALVDDDGYRIISIELRAQGGVIADGPTVNIPDQWALTVRRD